jgi:hypothetical protein
VDQIWIAAWIAIWIDDGSLARYTEDRAGEQSLTNKNKQYRVSNNFSTKKGASTMKTQANAQSQPGKKLTVNKETIRVLATDQLTGAPADKRSTTADCSITC